MLAAMKRLLMMMLVLLAGLPAQAQELLGHGGPVRALAVLQREGAPVAALAATPAGVLAAAGFDGVVRVWAQGPVQEWLGHQGAVTGLAWHGDELFSVGQDGTLRVWGGQPRLLAEAGLPRTAVVAVAEGAAVAGVDGQVVLPHGATLAVGDRPVVALAARGNMLAAASMGGAVLVWALPEGRLLHRLEGPGLPVWSLAFSADGATLYSGGQDRRVRAWAVASGAALGPVAAEPPAHSSAGTAVFGACAACHALGAEAAPMAGPSLHRLFGRRMGSLPGYGYSARLARGDVVWGRETLARLLTEGPDVMLPGTHMPVQRMSEPAELAALLDFLEAATK